MTAPSRALAARLFLDSRVRTASFALLLCFAGFADPVGYRKVYPTVADRLAFARSFGANKALEIFYGAPHDILTVGGYTAWRAGGLGVVVAAVAGLLAAVRVLRAEEDAHRQELLLAGIISRASAFAVALAVCVGGIAVIWLGLTIGLVAGRLPVAGSSFLALTTLSPAVVFVGVGAVTSQLASTRRGALELGTAAIAIALLLRVVADTKPAAGWLRWLTPFGWTESMQPFAHPRPWLLVLPFASAGALSLAGWVGASWRDVGSGLVGLRERPVRHTLAPSPITLAAREKSVALASWCIGIATFGVVVGLLSTSFTSQSLPANFRRALHRFGGASLTTPKGAIGLYFLFFVLVISLLACWTVTALRHDEESGQLESVFAHPVARRPWLLEHLVVGAAGVIGLGLLAGLSSWAGAAIAGAGVPIGSLIAAGLNCVPASLLFLCIAALAFGAVPRLTVGVAYGGVVAAFVWQLLASSLGVPHWLVGISPFQHVAPVPAEPFRTWSALAMMAIALGAAAVATEAFRRRDLAGS